MKNIYILLIICTFSTIGNAQFTQTDEDQFQTVLDTYISQNNLVGLSVAIYNSNSSWTGTDGISEVSDSINASHKFAIGSVSKTITSATILSMYEEGLLDLDDPLSNYLPLTAWVTPTITIRQLLNHTSGLYNYTSHPNLVQDIFYNSTTIITPADIFSTYMGGSSFSPGTDWGYSNTNYVLLGMIIESISGQTYYQEARDRFGFTTNYPSLSLAPEESSTDDLAHLWIDTVGVGNYFDVQATAMSTNALFSSAGAAGAYVSTPLDIAKWAYDLYSGEILQTTTMQELVDTVAGSDGYGLGAMLHLTDCGQNTIGHNGGIYYRTSTFYSTNKDFAISVHTNDANAFVVLEALANDLFCTYNGTSSVDNLTEEESLISVYPNPFQETINLEYISDKNEPISVSVINSLGEIIYGRTLSGSEASKNSIELSGLNFPAGVYLLKITTDTMTESMRMVKID